ncbi:MAG: HAMP domain-containing sensor histidine kinase [Candidatus Manganitrophus sp.]|nr:HAMP domain-containing sensor histidine kinase [Candidatus Manganitrophus sp.]
MENSKDAQLLSAFQEYAREINTFRLRIGCILGFTLVPLFSLLDYYAVPEHFKTFLLIRLVSSATTLFLFLFTFTSFGKKHITWIGALTAILIGGTIAMMTRYLGGYQSPYYAGLNLVMLAISMLFAWDLRITAAICLTMYAFYIVPILLYDQIEHTEILINNNAFLISTMFIGLTSAYFISRLRYQEFESRYKMEESRKALEVSNQKLRELSYLKGQFFADISHELRTPLAVIRGEAEVTLRGKEKPVAEYKRVLHYIILLADQLNKLVSDLLFLARSDSGVLQMEKRDVSLHEIVREAFREGEILAMRKGITLTLKEPAEDELFLRGDPQRLKQLFLIIIDNAINYSKMGGEVALALGREEGDGKVNISDQGVGIPKDALPHVFERFYRVEKTKSMANGTGLGLPIAKWIAETHEGKIAIESEIGVGTTVTVRLPLAEKVRV